MTLPAADRPNAELAIAAAVSGDHAAFIDNARAAADAMREVVSPTPLQANALLSQRYSANILLKREDLTAVRSYKLRGAYNFFRKALSATSETTPEHSASANGAHPTPRFVCASAGNHAQGFAFACSHFGVDGTIFMPVTTPEQKVAKTREFGGDRITIELEGDIFDQCYQAAIARAADTGAILVPPFDHPDVIEGQASVALEVLAQAPSPIDVLVLPVGGGGLSAGMAPVLAAHSPETKIILVEPAGAPSLRQSLREGRRVRLDAVNTFVDGAAVAEIGALNFEMLRTYDPNEMVIVDEDHLCGTIIEMLNSEGIVLEPAGALALHALNAIPSSTLAGKTVVCVTTGGNFDFERLPEVKERALRATGRKKYYILRLPQRPGALRDFLDLLGPGDDIARFEYLKKSARNFGSILIGIESADPANFTTLEARMLDQGFTHRDITDDELIARFVV